jgi:hypothetical protein
MRPAIEAEATRSVPAIPAALGDMAGSIGAALIGAESATARSTYQERCSPTAR